MGGTPCKHVQITDLCVCGCLRALGDIKNFEAFSCVKNIGEWGLPSKFIKITLSLCGC